MTQQRFHQVHIRPPQVQRRSFRAFFNSGLFTAVASPIIMLVAWEAVVRIGLIDARFFPTPSSVIVQLAALASSGELFVHAMWSIGRILIGFVLGAVPAVLLGLAMGISPFLRAFLKPAIASIYPIPKVALFPVIMLIFGLGEPSKWAIVSVAVFFQVLLSTLSGVLGVDNIYYDVARNFGARKWQIYRTVALPGALPFIFTGFQLGLGMALIVVIIAENFGTKVGLGHLIWRSWQLFEVRDMYVGLLVVALLGYSSQLGLSWIEGKCLRWKPPQNALVKL